VTTYSAGACRAGAGRLGRDGALPKAATDRAAAVPARARTAVLAAAGPGGPGRGVVGVGRHRAGDRIRAGLPAPGYLARAAPGHHRHPPGRHGSVRRVRAASLAGPARTGSATGPAGSPNGPRSAPSRLAWPGRSPIICWPRLGAARGALAHHHPRVLPAGPGVGQGDRAGPRCVLMLTPQDQPRPGPLAGLPGTRRDRPRTRAPTNRHPGAVPQPGHDGPPVVHGTADRTRTPALPEIDQARLIASRLTAAGKRISRRALRASESRAPTRP
jgi:hypothetical protein